MFIISRKKIDDLAPVKEGTYQAVCVSVIDIGQQFNEKFGNTTHQVIFGFELPDQRMSIVGKDGKITDTPRLISKKYNCSLHEKAILTKDLQSWRGKRFTAEEENGFDLSSLLTENCMLQILHSKGDGKTYATISAIVPIYKGMKKLDPETPVRYFNFKEHGVEIPPDIPEWIVKLIKNSDEWKLLTSCDDDGNAYSNVTYVTK